MALLDSSGLFATALRHLCLLFTCNITELLLHIADGTSIRHNSSGHRYLRVSRTDKNSTSGEVRKNNPQFPHYIIRGASQDKAHHSSSPSLGAVGFETSSSLHLIAETAKYVWLKGFQFATYTYIAFVAGDSLAAPSLNP
ncbi:hypothetical protein BGX38DRAFT_1191448, partial [Terfezia claveryi]